MSATVLSIERFRSPLSTPADPVAELARRARRGDLEAADELFRRHADMVMGYCLRFARGDRPLANDLTQETFVTAVAHLATLQEPERFSGWLRTVTRRTCLRWAEQKRSERKALDRLVHEPRTEAPEEVQTSRIVREVVEACPDPALRQPATLFYTPPPHTTDEIADELGISRTAVTTRLHRFRAWARARMLTRLVEAMECSR